MAEFSEIYEGCSESNVHFYMETRTAAKSKITLFDRAMSQLENILFDIVSLPEFLRSEIKMAYKYNNLVKIQNCIKCFCFFSFVGVHETTTLPLSFSTH